MMLLMCRERDNVIKYYSDVFGTGTDFYSFILNVYYCDMFDLP